MPKKIDPLVAIGIPTWGKVSMTWAQTYKRIGGPLGANVVELSPVVGKPIAEARNELMQGAIQNNCDFILFLGDDVLAPPDVLHRLLTRMWENPDISMITGVYWTKQWPSHPYIWRGIQRGPYLDWKYGEFFEIDYSGIDCLLIRLTPEMKALGPDWFSTNWRWEEDEDKAPVLLATEDFYFFTKTRKAGMKLYVDTNVQCGHEDRTTGMQFALTTEMPQYTGKEAYWPKGETELAPVYKVADLGCGFDDKYWGREEQVKVIRFDTNEKVLPDFRCDLRQLPADDQSFDMVHSKHVLEHFPREELKDLLTEWLRILRVGGTFEMHVPNVISAMRKILLMEEGLIKVDTYPWWQIYGQQVDQYDFHKNGFTPRKVKMLLEGLGLEDVEIDMTGTDNDPDLNIVGRGKKTVHSTTASLLPDWDMIADKEEIVMPGVREEEDEPIVAI